MKITHPLFLTLTLCISSAQATLVKTDFLNPNDGLIVKDTATNYEWLSPLYTKGQLYNSPFVQSVISNHGFRYATGPEVVSMINANFGNPSTSAPGDLASLNAATSYFSFFGVANSYDCTTGLCRETYGVTSTPVGFSSYRVYGMFQLVPYPTESFGYGYFAATGGIENTDSSPRIGSWLIRPAAETGVPEPSTTALIGLGLVLVASHRRIRSSHTAMKINYALPLTLTLCISSAQATLVKTDFLNPNDGLIVKDTATQFEWLTPLYTKGQEYNSPFIQSLISNHGFRYATAQEATNLIVNNFGIVTTTAPGDAAGYTAANSYISLFGVSGSGQVFSPGGNGPTFQRMLGLTSTLAPGYSNWYQAFGMQSTSNGFGFAWMGLQDPGFNGTFTNGSYLIRPSADSSVPEPSTTAFLLLGLSLLAASKTVRRNL